ncbi:5-oxoprolinase subunit PxpA [Pedobacter sp. ASV1-7]|uniref:LamB/YcsF family protein n=1 Tax=Pedobacter sp. ASV1-7 TaxID=3145237 RepID=UPI0032E92AA7
MSNDQYNVDLNCDMGESYGTYQIGNEEAIFPYITSANIACGFHAGDPTVMKRTVKLALKYNVEIGAHPGLPDLQGFGRREMAVSADEAYDIVVYQIGALMGFVKSEGGALHHVKPHGALYNMAAVNADIAEAIAEAVYKINPALVLYGLSGSELTKAGSKIGLRVANEVFADRTYQDDGSLTSRKLHNALIGDEGQAVAQSLRMVKEGLVTSVNGLDVAIKADTICLHSDTEHAAKFAAKIHTIFKEKNIGLQAP